MKYFTYIIILALTACATGKKEPRRIVIVKSTFDSVIHSASCMYEHHLNEEAKTRIVEGLVFSSVEECKKSGKLEEASALSKKEAHAYHAAKIDAQRKKSEHEQNARMAEFEKDRVSKVKEYIRANPQYKKYEAAALAFNVQIGMPEALAIATMGREPKINRTVTANRARNQLVFGSKYYVYTENGFVVAVQDF